MMLIFTFVFCLDCISYLFHVFFPGQMLVFIKGHSAFLTSVVSGPGNLSSVCLPDISPTHRTLSHVSSFSVNCMNILSSQNVKFDFALKRHVNCGFINICCIYQFSLILLLSRSTKINVH